MQSNRPTAEHTALFHQMAEAMGVNLEQEILAGRLDLETLTNSIQRCKGCGGPKACTKWLEHAEVGAEPDAPGYCRNASMLKMQQVLARLKQG